MSHLTYPEACVVGLVQGVTELFPVSSIGHNVLLPALIGGGWATDLNVGASESPYLAFIVGMHVATALALLIYFWRDWVRIIGAFFVSFQQFAQPAPGTKRWQPQSAEQKLAWMIVFATIPVGLVGLKYEHEFRVITGHAITAAYFLIANGVILYAAERFRRPASVRADREQEAARAQAAAGVTAHGVQAAAGVEAASAAQAGPVSERTSAGALQGRQPGSGGGSGQDEPRGEQVVQAAESDQRLAGMSYLRSVVLGAAQVLALLAGISRDGVVMAGGMFSGLSRQDAARFSFLLATPVIFAAGALKLGDLFGPLGNGIRGQVLVGSVLSGIGAYLSVRFLLRYFRTRTLYPFAIYCAVVGLGSIAYLSLR